MNLLKEKLLNDTFQKVMEVALISNQPLNILNEIVAEDVMGFGTTIDERIFSLSEFRNLINRQREQSEGIQMEWNYVTVHHQFSADGNFAVFADDVWTTVVVNNETIKIDFRFTVIFEFQNNKWLLVHFHSSKPENVLSEADTFGIEDWKQKNAELEKLVNEKTAELQKSLADLKATQSQLIQSEKMASLGELTAGIAHEIQNPLNFVNNFSELSNELINEMNAEIDKGDMEEAKFIAKDIKSNLEKISHHGKRADSIVKGMLQHSRNSSGTKEPTDINKLADEYLRLAYHGLRAKDKSFNATLETDYDDSIGIIPVLAQEIGRVILNLITNAFYACNERKKAELENYEPTIWISTKKLKDNIVISIKDNGRGIPKHAVDKIFQPFFTTKPAGQGTGLGLSMSYDIVIKGHGGELLVESEDNRGTIFRIVLPITSINKNNTE